MSFTSKIGLVHLISDWLRATDQERNDFLEQRPLVRIRFLRDQYHLEKDELRLIIKEDRENIARTAHDVLLIVNPEHPESWHGALMFNGPMAKGGTGPTGPGWGGPQWTCIESIEPRMATAGVATSVTVTGWIFDKDNHAIFFEKDGPPPHRWTPTRIDIDEAVGSFVAVGELTLAAGTYAVTIRDKKPGGLTIAKNILPDAMVVT